MRWRRWGIARRGEEHSEASEESGFGCPQTARTCLSKVFSLSPHGERAGVRGGLTRNHIKQGQRC
ncbi:hypothetical protein CBM2587_A10212 [Cupriavidus taiwanensis]|uniref:Uncharacterized protein n=1 Tax=Cupriavidus taiwanensis TaxID=164546 RepID=A0A375BCD1_9BURK|nr:hypothetical protein CBM2587_A10212 [Cupriavidus taiwanensis]